MMNTAKNTSAGRYIKLRDEGESRNLLTGFPLCVACFIMPSSIIRKFGCAFLIMRAAQLPCTALMMIRANKLNFYVLVVTARLADDRTLWQCSPWLARAWRPRLARPGHSCRGHPTCHLAGTRGRNSQRCAGLRIW